MNDAVLEAELKEWQSLHKVAVTELSLFKDANRVLRQELLDLRAENTKLRRTLRRAGL